MSRYRRTSLTKLQSSRLGVLPILMEHDPFTLPIPPQELGYESSMSPESAKRKRGSRDPSPVDDGDMDIHTPKRSRSRVRSADEDGTSAHQHSIRRKRGIRNLSNLSLRHAAEQQPLPLSPRGSKFQEGSLTDKPSDAPPSLYTRIAQADGGKFERLDDLMTDYHAADHAVHDIPGGEDIVMADTTGEHHGAEAVATAQGTGFFRFGRSLAGNFHPVTLWNRIWNEQKEELTRQNMLEAERKAKLKAEVEARYAEMKQTGQFEFHASSSTAGPADAASTPYDSAVSLEHSRRPQIHKRNPSAGSQVSTSRGGTDSHDENEAPSTASKALRSIRSRLYLKRPSLSNLKHDLKRVKSDLNVGGSVRRESSSSASPVKADFEDSALQKSHSKFDFKKQNRLSKRVSDLELKLRHARKELEDALADASPLPKLGSRYERFTPTPSLKRPKFIPGQLPSLPSERILFPELLEIADETGINAPAVTRANALRHDRVASEGEDEETVKAPRAKAYPAHASTLFSPEQEIQNPSTSWKDTTQPGQELHLSDQQTAKPSLKINNMDTALNITDSANTKASTYADLDHKLKALDESYKASRKSSASKKRKSGGNSDDAAFKLGRDEINLDDDDNEWEEANQTPKKKRKSGASKSNVAPANTHNSVSAVTKSPKAKKNKKSKKHSLRHASPNEVKNGESTSDSIGEEGTPRSNQARNSLDAQAHQLEPLYEEEEEMVIVPLKDEPSRPTAKATPARYGRPRSVTPRSQAQTAAGVVQKTRQARVISPPPHAHSKVIEVTNETATAVPGQDDVPMLPTEDADGAESQDELQEVDTKKKATMGVPMVRKEDYKWPDDVF